MKDHMCDGVTSKNEKCQRVADAKQGRKYYCWQHGKMESPRKTTPREASPQRSKRKDEVRTIESFIDLKVELRPEQRVAVEHLFKHRGLLVTYKPGQGKTLIAVSAMHCFLSTDPTMTVVFVSPVSLIANFIKEIKKYGLDLEKPPLKGRVHIYGKESFYSRIKKEKRVVESSTPSSTTPTEENDKSSKEVIDLIIPRSNVFLILDECHHYRNTVKSKSKKPAADTKAKGAIATSIIEYARTCAKVLELTGTPVKNKPSDIINLISIIADPSQPQITETFFNKVIMSRAPYGINAFNEYFKCKVCCDVPIASLLTNESSNYPTLIEASDTETTFVMSDQYYARYLKVQKAMADEYLIDLYGSPERYKIFYSGLRRASLSLDGPESPKIMWTVNKVIEEAKAGRRSIVFSSWLESGLNQVAELLADMDVPFVMIRGDVSVKEREINKLSYNSGKVMIMLLSRAGGEGLDLQCTRNVVLMEKSWSPSDDEQVIGRACRFLSHASLPLEERFVTVYRLTLVKPLTKDPSDTLDSIDQILTSLCYEEKQPLIEDIKARMYVASITNTLCKCGVSETSSTSTSSTSTSSSSTSSSTSTSSTSTSSTSTSSTSSTCSTI